MTGNDIFGVSQIFIVGHPGMSPRVPAPLRDLYASPSRALPSPFAPCLAPSSLRCALGSALPPLVAYNYQAYEEQRTSSAGGEKIVGGNIYTGIQLSSNDVIIALNAARPPCPAGLVLVLIHASVNLPRATPPLTTYIIELVL